MAERKCSVVILAAGFSSRMKQAKFSLQFDHKRTFLEKILEEYKLFNCSEIIVVLNSEGIKRLKELELSIPNDVKIILNEHPEKERFYSLQLGLRQLHNIESVFIQNVDNPFVDQEVLSLLYEHSNKADYIVPAFKGKGGHPILVSKQVTEAVIEEEDYNQNLKVYLEKFVNLKVESKNDDILKDINDHKNLVKYFIKKSN